MNTVQPNNTLAQITILVLWINVAVAFVGALLSTVQCLLVLQSRTGAFAFSDAKTFDEVVTLFFWVKVSVSIVAASLFIRWFYRTYVALRNSGGRTLSFANHWAASAWFVPLLNWVRPYVIMREIWEGMQLLGRNRTTNFRMQQTSMIEIWWGCWWLSLILRGRAVRLTTQNEDIMETMEIQSLLAAGSELLSLVAGVLLIQIIKKVLLFERRLQNPIIT